MDTKQVKDGYHRHSCPVCGKQFYSDDQFWVYKRCPHKPIYFCTYGCLRKYDGGGISVKKRSAGGIKLRQDGQVDRRYSMAHYAVYLRETGELVCKGTADECAEVLDKNRSFIFTQRRIARNGYQSKYIIVKEGEV